jgi:hypothetical protein
MKNKGHFSFAISLSVLDHLGRNLYRSFVTVLGEAISNAWDADAHNVWIYVDKEAGSLYIKDDGVGMSRTDFQNKFLKVGYSKRKSGVKSAAGRPFIGRKGIGKLALLSCASKITVISRVKGHSYVGGVIDNTGLEKAIKRDLTPDKYPLGKWELSAFQQYTVDHDHGTIIRFEAIKEGIRNSLEFLTTSVALYFRFSLLDKTFNIWMNGTLITHECLGKLAKKTEFLWRINDLKDPYVDKLEAGWDEETGLKEKTKLKVDGNIKGFVGSVLKPQDLKIRTTDDERVGVDLFVNGRLRERNILEHITTARVVESYLYGQVHFDDMDDGSGTDRFTSNREGVIADDPMHQEMLRIVKDEVIYPILGQWDKWRRDHKHDGDPENTEIPLKERRSQELFNAVSEEYIPPKGSVNRREVDSWVDDLSSDARFNFASYAECFVSENLVRRFVMENEIPLSPEAEKEVADRRKSETDSKGRGNISIEIRKTDNSLSYLAMNFLAALVDKKDPVKDACLLRDANEYKPMRDALAHTALLSDEAKLKLTSVYQNIKGRVQALLIMKAKTK